MKRAGEDAKRQLSYCNAKALGRECTHVKVPRRETIRQNKTKDAVARLATHLDRRVEGAMS